MEQIKSMLSETKLMVDKFKLYVADSTKKIEAFMRKIDPKTVIEHKNV